MGDIPFELLPLAAGSATGVVGGGTSHDKSRILDHWLPVGRNKVVGVYQSRCVFALPCAWCSSRSLFCVINTAAWSCGICRIWCCTLCRRSTRCRRASWPSLGPCARTSGCSTPRREATASKCVLQRSVQNLLLMMLLILSGYERRLQRGSQEDLEKGSQPQQPTRVSGLLDPTPCARVRMLRWHAAALVLFGGKHERDQARSGRASACFPFLVLMDWLTMLVSS